jgi:hypothetical protein
MSDRMTMSDWKHINYMHYRHENWGSPVTSISKSLVFNLENLRIFANKPCVLTSKAFTQSGHSPKSQHYVGNAADWRLLNSSLVEMYILAERFNFTGIGLYPPIHIVNENIERVSGKLPFVHTDVRELDPLNVQSRWIGIPVQCKDENLSLRYFELNFENFMLYCSKY